MCHKITAYTWSENTFEHKFLEPYFKKFAWKFKTEISANYATKHESLLFALPLLIC